MSNDSLATARAIRQPLPSVKNILDQFDSLTYQKGAAVIGMFERYMGAETFRKGVNAYIAAHADGAGSTDDLLAALSKQAGSDLTTPFHSFLDQAGVPLVQASISCGTRPVLTLRQSRFLPLGSEAKQDRTWQIFDLLQTRLDSTDDGEVRERILRALGSVRDPARSARVLALMLNPKLRKQETLGPLFRQGADARTRDAAWEFVKAHYDELLPRSSEIYASYLPYTATGHCDTAHADDAKAFFEPRAAAQPDMPKNLRQAVESIRLCAAQAAAQSESARAFFKARATTRLKGPPLR